MARLSCSTDCGRVRAIAKQGRKVVGRTLVPAAGAKQAVEVNLAKRTGVALADGSMKVRVELWVEPPGQATTHAGAALKLIRARAVGDSPGRG